MGGIKNEAADENWLAAYMGENVIYVGASTVTNGKAEERGCFAVNRGDFMKQAKFFGHTEPAPRYKTLEEWSREVNAWTANGQKGKAAIMPGRKFLKQPFERYRP